LLTPAFQKERWNGDKESFSEGFQHTDEITLLSITLESAGSNVSDKYIAYYFDITRAWIIPGLENLSSKPVKDLPDLESAIGKLRDKLKSVGYNADDFDNKITLSDLMAPNRSVRIAWRLEHSLIPNPPQSRFDELFLQKKRVGFISGYRIVTQKTTDGWRISYLESLSSVD
jgi:hypothetical protein